MHVYGSFFSYYWWWKKIEYYEFFFKIDIDFMLVFDRQHSVSGASFYIQGYIFSRHTYGCCLQYYLSTKITLSDKKFSYLKIIFFRLPLGSIYIWDKDLFGSKISCDYFGKQQIQRYLIETSDARAEAFSAWLLTFSTSARN